MLLVRRRLAGLACLPLLVLSACSDDPPPSAAEPTPTVTTSVEPSPTEEPETPWDRVPERAREQSRDGAIAFAKYWVKVFNKAVASLDAEDLRALSSAECESCSNYLDRIEGMSANGGSFTGGKWRVLQAGAVPAQPPGEEIVELRVAIDSAVSKPTKDAEEVTSVGSEENFSVYVVWVGDGWEVTWIRIHG